MNKQFNLIIFIILIIAGFMAINFWRSVSAPFSDQSEQQYFIVVAGQVVKEIAGNLQQAELIGSTFDFEVFVWLKRMEKSFQTGEYLLNPNMSIREIVNLLTTQGGTNEQEIKILEGWTAQEIGNYLENQDIVQTKEFLGVVGFPQTAEGLESRSGRDFSLQYSFLSDKPKETGLEGYLFPDTYRIFSNASIGEIVQKMLNNFDKKLTLEMRQEIQQNKMTIFETIILASILEAEVKTYEDKRNAASVFYKRLNTGMPLQADSTVNYITGKTTPRVSATDLKIDSLYNTYKYRGLPPGPICNPGLESIQAAIYPLKNNYWYFLTDKEGQAHFAETLEGHVENRQKYLQ